MALKPAQQTKIKNYINADAVLSLISNTNDGAYDIANAMNVEATPAFVVWRTTYTPAQIREAINASITQLDNLTASKRQSLLWWAEGNQDASKASVQAAMTDLTAGQTALQNSVLDGAKRNATIAEKVLANGTGTTASPAKTTFEGFITYQDIAAARNS